MAKKGSGVSRFSIDRAGLALEFNPAGVADRLLNYGEERFAAARDFYSDFYEKGAQALETSRVRQFKEIVRVMAALGYPRDEQDWLDVGTGNGHFPRYLSDRLTARVNVWAIDPSLPEETRHFKRLGLEQLPHASLPRQFGILSFLDVFEHFDDPKRALKKVIEILGDGGLLVVKVPNKDSLMYRVSRRLRGVLPSFSRSIMKRLYQVDYPPPHYFYYDDSSLRSTLGDRFEVNGIAYLPEIYLSGLWTRLWGMPPLVKPFYYLAGLFYAFLARGRAADSLLLVARKVGAKERRGSAETSTSSPAPTAE